MFKELIKGILSHVCVFKKTVHYLTSIPDPVDMSSAISLRQENALYRQLKTKGCHLLLFGEGGSGKTHMARKLFYRVSKCYDRLAWVEYGTNMRTTLLSSFPEFDYEPDPEIRFAKIIKKLSEAPQKTILFIDDAKEHANQDEVLTRLTGLGITIFITSRCEKIAPYISYRIQPLNTNECTELFYTYYRADRKHKHIKVVRNLVDALNRNPMLVILIGRVMGNDRNLLMFAQRIMIDSRETQGLSSKTLHEYIGKLIKVSNCVPEEKRIMQSLALLPSGEIPAEACGWFKIDASRMELLVAKGWLDKKTTSGAYVLHDLIREYFREKTIPERVVTRFLQHVTTQPFFTEEDTSEDIQYKLDSIEEAINLTNSSCPYYGDALIFLGNIYYELDWYAMALSRYDQALKSIADKTEIDYNRILDIYWGMGMVYDDLGMYDKALESYRNAEDTIIKIGAVDHTIIAGLNNNIGTVHLTLADYSKALDYLQKALKDQEQFLGHYHQDTANSYGNIGNAYYKKGEFKTAQEYYQKALSIQKELFGEMHPDVANIYNNIGNTYSEIADYKTAQNYYQKALMIREEVLGSVHLDTASSYHNTGNVYSDMGEYVEAHQFYKKAEDIVYAVYGPNHPVTAQVYASIGVTYYEQGQYEKAFEYCEKALQIQEDILGFEHPDTANSYNNIGEVYFRKKELVKAMEYHLKALQIRDNAMEPNLLECAESYDNVGATYCATGNWSKAKEYCERALIIQQDNLPECHPAIAKTLVHLGDVCSACNDNDKAMEYYLKSLKIYLAGLGCNHPYTIRTQSLIKDKVLSIYPEVNFDGWIQERLDA